MGSQSSSTWQQLCAMRVLGAQGPSGLCCFADRVETPGSPASISSPTYGWEKPNCSNGVFGWMREGWGGQGLPTAPCCWQLRPGASAVPSQMLGGRTQLWVHHGPHHAQLSPTLQGPQPAPPPPPWAPRNPRRALLAPGEAAGWGEMNGRQKIGMLQGGTVPLFGCCKSNVPACSCSVKGDVWCSSPFPAAGWGSLGTAPHLIHLFASQVQPGQAQGAQPGAAPTVPQPGE